MSLLFVVTIVLVLAATIHSWMGERQVVRPILSGGAALAPRLRLMIRVAWHSISALALVFAAIFSGLALTPADAQGRLTVAIFSASFFLLGAAALFVAGPRHVGWPLLFALSLLSGLSLLQRP